MIKILLGVIVTLLVLAPASSYAATSGVRSCDDNKSCVVTYKNGTQFVQLSSAKWKCIIDVMDAITKPTVHDSLIDSITENAGLGICLKNG